MSIEDPRRDVIRHLGDIRKEVLASIEGLTDEQFNDQGLDGWSVKDHILHLAFWHELRASEIVRISAGYEHAWPLSVDSQILNDLVQPARANLSIDQARWEYESAIQRVISHVSKASDRGLELTRYGEVGLLTSHDLGHADAIRKWRAERGF